MLRPEQVERLSQLMSGELPPEEAEALHAQLERDPELRQAWERLASLEQVTQALAPAPLSVERAIARALPPPKANRWRSGLLVVAAMAAAAAAAWALWPMSRVVETVEVVDRVAPVQVLADSEVRREGEQVYRLLKGSALFEGTLTVHVDEETLEVRGRALISKEPSQALSHVTDLVTPTPEVLQMMSDAKSTWLTAAIAVMVFTGEVQAQEKITAGKSYAKPPAASPSVVKAWPTQDAAPSPPTEVIDAQLLNDAVVANASALSKCFEAGLKQNPKLGGKLTALLTLSASGKLEEATVGEDTVKNPFVAACVLQAMQQVKFPAPKGVDKVQVAYPMEFAARSGNGGELIFPPSKDFPSCKYIVDRTDKVSVEVGASPSTGPVDAKVTVVLFSEAECDFCVRAHVVLKQLQTDYAGKVRFVFKHRPLPRHPGARQASLALQAAHAQGKFWELLDRAYAEPTETQGGLYDAQARALGLDLQRYRRDVAAPQTAAAIDADLAQGEKLGVKGVPDWFINGQEIVGFRPIEVMKKAIDAELAAAPTK